MKEKNLRKYHRILGVVLAVFVVAQAGTGLYFTFVELLSDAGSHEHHEHVDYNHFLSPIAAAHAHSNEPEETGQNNKHMPMHLESGTERNHQEPSHAHPDYKENGETEASISIPGMLHYGGGVIGGAYRMLLSVGLLVQVATGLIIFKKRIT